MSDERIAAPLIDYEAEAAKFYQLLPTLFMYTLLEGETGCKFILKNGKEILANEVVQITQDAAGDLWIETLWEYSPGQRCNLRSCAAFRADAVVAVAWIDPDEAP